MRLVDEWASFLPAATFDSFRADLGLTYRAAALALLAIGPGAVVGSACTVMADTRSRRVLATAGVAVYSAALALFAASSAPWMLIAGGFGVGLGATLLVDTVEVALVDLCGEHGRALERALARMNVAAGVGDLAGPAVVAATAALGWSWRVPLWITAGATLGYGVLVARTPLPRPAVAPTEPGTKAETSEWLGARALVRRADVWWAGACGAALVALDEAFVAYVIAFLHRDDGLSPAVATAITSAFVIGGLVAATRLARETGSAAPRRRRGEALRTSAITMLAAAVVLCAWPVPFVVAGSGFVIGAATIAFWVPFQAMTLRLVPGRAGAVRAIVGTIEMAGLAVTPAIGAIADRYGLHAGLIAYCCIPALLVLLTMRRVLPGFCLGAVGGIQTAPTARDGEGRLALHDE